MKINGKLIHRSQPPYIIAELSANHNGSINRAFESIKVAKQNIDYGTSLNWNDIA